MPYPLSASKLLAYQRCPQAYYFKYERKLPEPSFFGSTALGIALHDTLRDIYSDWNYGQPIPPLDWFAQCWKKHNETLSETHIHEGWMALENYYRKYIADSPMMRKPLGSEGKINGTIETNNVEVTIRGRYDRLHYWKDGLALIDYKTSKTVKPPESLDLQLGVYALILQQTYHQALKQLILIYVRAGEEINYSVTTQHMDQVHELINDLALRLKADQRWEPVVDQG